MRAQRLTRALASTREVVQELTLDKRLGVVGDDESEKDGSVSLLCGEAEEEIRSRGGLCSAKFDANITTSELRFETLTIGTRLTIGQAELSITRIGKPCYEACALIQTGTSCPLTQHCAFASVSRGGVIQTDDEIQMHTALATAHISTAAHDQIETTGNNPKD